MHILPNQPVENLEFLKSLVEPEIRFPSHDKSVQFKSNEEFEKLKKYILLNLYNIKNINSFSGD